MRRAGSDGDARRAERDAGEAARQPAVGAQGSLGGAAERARHRLGASCAAVAGGRLDVDGHGVVRGRDLVRDDPVSDDPICRDLVRHKSVTRSPVCSNPIRRNSVGNNPARHDPVSNDLVKHEPVRRNSVGNNPARHDPVSNDLVKHEPVRRNSVGNNPARHDPVSNDLVKHEPVRRTPVRNHPVSSDLVRRDSVGNGPVRLDAVRRDPVQHEPVRGDLGVVQRAHVIRRSRSGIRVAWAGFGWHRRPPRGIEKRGRAPGVTKASWLGERPPVHPTARTPQSTHGQGFGRCDAR
ncbi:hypothetical protein GCM10027610_118690 [Dactylosporangium cerinum]